MNLVTRNPDDLSEFDVVNAGLSRAGIFNPFACFVTYITAERPAPFV
jgi:hypothetical protein